jgi:hypothetical protein
MSEMKRRLCFWAGSAGIVLAGVYIVSMPAFAQEPAVSYDTSRVAGNFDQIRLLPPGEAAPRTADGHPDLTGRYYPNKAGRMLQGGYRVVDSIMRQFDATVTPQAREVYTPEGEQYQDPPFPYGSCPAGGTPISITMQSSEHGPMELIQLPGKVWILTEFPQTIRYIPTDGRPHSDDPDVSYVGESVGHWEGDTLVVDTIAVDGRQLMNFERWHPSEQQHVVERFTRTSENYLVYDLMIEDPAVLAEPYVHVPRTWTLAQDPNDLWTEYICTANEEPGYMQNMTPEQRQEIEGGRGGRGGQ